MNFSTITFARQNSAKGKSVQWLIVLVFSIIVSNILFPIKAQQNVSSEQFKTAFIFHLLDKVTWQNESQISRFEIAVLGEDDRLVSQINRVGQQRKIKGKSIKAQLVNQLDQLPKFHIVFIPDPPPLSLGQVTRITTRTNTLIVTEETEDKKNTMVNLLRTDSGSYTFEINKSNIVFEYLQINPDILLIGGSEMDVAELFKESSDELTELKNELKSQQEALKKSRAQLARSEQQYKAALKESERIKEDMRLLAKELEEKTKLIEAKNISIREKEGELLAIQNELQSASDRLNTNNALLGERLNTIKSKEQDISKLTDAINNNLNILKSQKDSIAEQQRIMDEQMKTLEAQGSQIEQQQWWLEISAVVLAVFVLLLMMIVYFNSERKKANLKLIEKNDALSEVQKELLVARDQAQAANEAKSSFLANMSHEIRTPMNAIIGMLHLTQQTQLSEKQNNYVTKIDNAANSLLEIINDILDFSKVEAGELKMEKIDFSLSKVLVDLANLTGMKIQQKGLELVYDVSPDIPEVLVGDPLRLSQILINLTNNAMKFTEKGEVRVKIEVIGTIGDQVHLKISVVDTGIGMSGEVANRLFKPFSQADSSTTRKFGGTGLGLAICKRLIQQMGGDISVSSQPKKGSAFVFDAKFGVKVKRTVLDRVEDVLSFKDKRIVLLIENQSTLAVMKRLLSSFNCQTITTQSFESYLGLLKTQQQSDRPIDCVFVDFSFVENNIEDFKTYAKSNAPKLAVLLPGISDKEEQVLESITPDTNLTKPITPSLLFDTLTQLFNQDKRQKISQKLARFDGREQLKALGKKLGSCKILVVEDNEINQEVAREILTQSLISVDVASNGLEAVQMVGAKKYDCILMDIQMPVMDGYQASKAIRERFGFKELPIIAMTANAMGGDKERCLASGMNDYISKPIRIKEFFETLKKWLDNGQPSSNSISEVSSTSKAEVKSKIDIEGGIELMGDQDVFFELLGQFKLQQASFINDAKELLSKNSFKELSKSAHDLKGVSANLFMNDLAAAATEFDQACRTENSSAATQAFKSTAQELEAVFETIDNLEKNNSSSGVES